MPTLLLKPKHKAVVAYYEALAEFEKRGITHETAVRSAFQSLLDLCAKEFHWKLVPEYAIRRHGQKSLSVDGALVDGFNLPHGYWEAKDTADDLDKEIKSKFTVGYPRTNILFQSPHRAVLYQGGRCVFDTDLTKPDQLVSILRVFLEYREPEFDQWSKAVDEFKERIAEHGQALKQIIERERKTNRAFVTAFAGFIELCRASLNPNLSEAAVEEMLIQHILTERIFRKIFDIGDFMQRNVIAVEIEKVIQALTLGYFSRDEFLRTLDRFYVAIEHAAASVADFPEKQKFLNAVYERFFQGFATKVADTHGIIYTPQVVVGFMVASVEHLLAAIFGKSLAQKDVHILDGFVGTGNFVVNIMRAVPRSALVRKYNDEFHCNEVMLLWYYVASMNIEYVYWEATRKYLPFEGICLVDTFDTALGEATAVRTPEREDSGISDELQHGFDFISKANTERIKRQPRSPIFVCIGNPPYNAWQQNENDNNKNRKYPELDRRLKATYIKDSTATLKSSLWDPYVRAIRWASDRIGASGIVAFITNNAFVGSRTCDGLRKHLEQDYDEIYHVILKGNARTSGEHRRREGGNIFDDKIRVGVGITFMVRRPNDGCPRSAKIFIYHVDDYMRSGEKQAVLAKAQSIAGLQFKSVTPDPEHGWLQHGADSQFRSLLMMGSKAAKRAGAVPAMDAPAVFLKYCRGITSNNDAYVYGFDCEILSRRARV